DLLQPSSCRRALFLEDLRDALAQPLEPAALDRLSEAGPRDQDVVVAHGEVALDLLERRTQAALDPVSFDRAAKLPRDGEAEPRAETVTFLAREGVEDEIAGGRGAAVPVDGVEVARAGKTVTTFQPGSGRETLAPLGAAALENRAAGAGRHPRAETMPALPASNVRLEGAFHRGARRKVSGMRPAPAGHRPV